MNKMDSRNINVLNLLLILSNALIPDLILTRVNPCYLDSTNGLLQQQSTIVIRGNKLQFAGMRKSLV
jgi:hypothetical protein